MEDEDDFNAEQPTSVRVTMPFNEQAIACFVGRGVVLLGRDDQTTAWDLTPTQRAVTVARLRALADQIERECV